MDIKQTLADLRLQAMSDMRFLASASKETLASCGYRNGNAEAVLDAFRRHDAKIEKTLRAWEKANPA